MAACVSASLLGAMQGLGSIWDWHRPSWLLSPLPSSTRLFVLSLHPPLCSVLMSAHSTAVVRHDTVGQETLLNLLLRNYLHYNLYDQVRSWGGALWDI